jgi:hypothetical protein
MISILERGFRLGKYSKTKNKAMSRIAFCEACSMIRNGVKSRVALEHTCGLERGAIPSDLESMNLLERSERGVSGDNAVIGGELYKKYKELQKKNPK